MRCLRCAIDYPPGERFCRRCGRALSHPPGSKATQDAQGLAALQDTQYVYSTYSPPASEDAVSDDVDGVLPSARPTGLPPSLALARPPLGMRGGTTLLPPGATGDEVGADTADHGGPFEDQGVYIAPPTSAEAASWPSGMEAAAEADARLAAEEDVLAAFRPKPTTIGQDSSWRVRRPRQRGMPSAPKLSRPLLGAVVAVIVVLFVAAVALQRHGAYTSDLQQARRYARAGQYQAALGKYADAIAAWPFNSGATHEQAGVRATVVAAQATAIAVAGQARAQATAAAQRQAIYGARSSLRRQIAGQADADAIATATAVAAATAGQ